MFRCLLIVAMVNTTCASDLETLRTGLSGSHPLAAAKQFAQARHAYLGTLSQCRYRLVKRERIDEKIQSYRHCDVTVTRKPLSIAMQYLSPSSLKGRRLLFIDGQNNNKIKVTKGGRRFAYVTFNMSLDGAVAREESFYTIKELSLFSTMKGLADECGEAIRVDPEAHHVVVKLEAGTVDQRPCTVLRIRHLLKRPELLSQVTTVHIDNELELPVRIVGHDWDGNLLGEFTYLNVRLK